MSISASQTPARSSNIANTADTVVADPASARNDAAAIGHRVGRRDDRLEPRAERGELRQQHAHRARDDDEQRREDRDDRDERHELVQVARVRTAERAGHRIEERQREREDDHDRPEERGDRRRHVEVRRDRGDAEAPSRVRELEPEHCARGDDGEDNASRDPASRTRRSRWSARPRRSRWSSPST